MKLHKVFVRAMWDPEAKVWVATSGDVPGLVAEAATERELLRKLKVLVPELLEENGLLAKNAPAEIELVLRSRREAKVRLKRAA